MFTMLRNSSQDRFFRGRTQPSNLIRGYDETLRRWGASSARVRKKNYLRKSSDLRACKGKGKGSCKGIEDGNAKKMHLGQSRNRYLGKDQGEPVIFKSSKLFEAKKRSKQSRGKNGVAIGTKKGGRKKEKGCNGHKDTTVFGHGFSVRKAQACFRSQKKKKNQELFSKPGEIECRAMTAHQKALRKEERSSRETKRTTASPEKGFRRGCWSGVEGWVRLWG